MRAYIKQIRFSENQKECERFVRTPFFDLLLGKGLYAALHILSSVSYQIKQEKFSHDFIIVVHSQYFGVFADFLKKKLCSGRFPLFSHHAKNERHTVNNTLKPKLSASYTELCSFKG